MGLNHYNFILIKRKFIINNYMIYGRLSMQGEMQDKCGVVGIHSVDDSKDVSSLIYYCLYALQHRGQESAGMATFSPDKGLNYYCYWWTSTKFDDLRSWFCYLHYGVKYATFKNDLNYYGLSIRLVRNNNDLFHQI